LSALLGSDALLLTLGEKQFSLPAPAHLLYWPLPSTDPEAPADAFTEGELLEYRQGQPRTAAIWYRKLAAAKTGPVRAGALLRLARVLRSLGRKEESRAVYAQLAAMEGVQAAGVPAELVGREAMSELSSTAQSLESLKQHLVGGRWRLTRGQFEFYWGKVSPKEQPPPERVLQADAAARVWSERARLSKTPTQEVAWVDGTPLFVMSGRGRVLIVKPEALLRQVMADDAALCAAVDAEGRMLAGRKDGLGRPVVRTAAESQLPWTLYFTRTPSLSDADLFNRRLFLMLGIAVMVLFLAAGTYFIAHAMRRETELSRLQSDFVSAVSHEFRSPLTSMRQLSEILAEGRLPSEDRRQLYYETLVSETHRLQRLVETLLNFGGMEAGVRRYHFEKTDLAPLVERVLSDFERQIGSASRRIEVNREVDRGAGVCMLEADPEALAVALRNLLDNAVKYSPVDTTVWLQWSVENRQVAIRVRDTGAGIPASEKKIIFQKFVRGSAAVAGNVKGTGVGLAIVNHIVAAHGGAIHVASEPGQGSTFTMWLPLAERT
jgi:signal transduction histidine kinase